MLAVSTVLGRELGCGRDVVGEVGSYTSPPYFHVCFWGVQEEDLVQLLAKHCYVQLGASVGSEAVQELLPSCIPSKLYKTKPPEKWASLVTAAHAKVSSMEPGHLGYVASFGTEGLGVSRDTVLPLGNGRL